MSNDLEDSLRAALRPVDPGEKFTAGVMARIADESRRTMRAPRPHTTALRWTSVALAVSLVIGILVARELQLRRTQRGLEARAELLQALKLTGEKLDIAYRVVNDEEHAEFTKDSGV
ncbi:MAG TPA: hypothetical protein VNY82_11375 [Steroidobacteraceae bacterium]|jgi:hypothetical protein|nr:hypothetical protein [Steroidobacteraceae bacterium]